MAGRRVEGAFDLRRGGRQDVPVPGLPAGDPARRGARGGLADRRPRRRERPAALAHWLLASPGPAWAGGGAVAQRTPLRVSPPTTGEGPSTTRERLATAMTGKPIRANSILPADRQDIELQTADGLTL